MANQVVNFAYPEMVDSTGGGPLLVTGSSSGGAVVVHTGGWGYGTVLVDVVHLYAHNNDASADVELLLEVHGDTTNPIRCLIPARAGLTLVLAGLPIVTASTLKAYASVANKITLFGHVDRIVEQ